MTQPLTYFIYDLETLINCFTFSGKFFNDPKIYTFEISSRKNERSELLTFLSYLQNCGCWMVGFNNLGFDWPIVQDLLMNPYTFDYTRAYLLCQQIINAQGYGFNQISLKDRIIPQIDLVKINHFDNANKRTPLKSLQVAMRLESVEDMPVEMGVPLTHEQMDDVIKYNHHDVTSTEEFLKRCLHLIDMRKELLDNGVLSGDVLNFSDVKIGTEYLIKKIGRAKCFQQNKPRQTFRESVAFKDIILDKIFYRTEEFEAVLEWFKKQIVYTKRAEDDELPKLQAKLGGLDFHFGVGGVHASVESQKFESNEEYVIKDVDVAGMYPSIAVANGFYPEHLGREFVDHYKQILLDRAKYKKGSSMNAMLKLAGNGVFGNSDNPFSCFYDPKYPKSITVNGQLQILQLAEMFSLIPGLQLIQANTDGITALVPRNLLYLFNMWCTDWERETGLTLEEVEYSKMWIRDVNNYICLMSNGYIKRKGAYWYPIEDKDMDSVWNKDFSMLAVQKATELCLVNGLKPEVAVMLISNPFDFMKRYKTPGGSAVYIGDKKMQKTVRYYVSKSGQPMKKVSNPKGKVGDFKRKKALKDEFYKKILSEIAPGTWDDRIHTKNRSRYEIVTTGIEAGKSVSECNVASDFNWYDVDFKYYIDEVKKLLIGV